MSAHLTLFLWVSEKEVGSSAGQVRSGRKGQGGRKEGDRMKKEEEH